MSSTLLAALLAVGLAQAAPASTPPAPPSCAEDPVFRLLDFWVGTWDVFVGETRVGTNEIRKILDGCAITEDWTDARGGRGYSLFYVEPSSGDWKQVWITGRALAPGGTKEKRLIERLDGGGVRFQGRIVDRDGGSHLDRTTLTPGDLNEVRQRIEVSTDGGETWRVTFDARYVRRQG